MFNVLESQGKSWAVFHDTTFIPSLTLAQFLPQLAKHDDHFFRLSVFKKLCKAKADATNKLPQYSFVEPRFTPELGLFEIDYPADYHPPHNICRGEQFLAGIYDAVRTSPYRDKILLVITFDEHDGTYDHVAPPAGAAAPAPGAVSRDGSFDFSRFGVRVPAIVVSSYVRPGTVFRAPPGSAPFDHTSLLATLRDWLQLESDPSKHFLPSPRIKAAPTLAPILTQDESNKIVDWPEITAACTIGDDDQSLGSPLGELQKGLLMAAVRKSCEDANSGESATKISAVPSLSTYEHALTFMHPDAL